MAQENVDIGIFQEKKVPERIYMQESSGYRVVALKAPSAHSGGVVVFYHPNEHFLAEALQFYDVNVVRFQLASGGQRCHIWGCYLAPDDASAIEDDVAAISQRLRGRNDGSQQF